VDTKHHIPTELLAAYAAGTLEEAFSLVIACHVSLCDTCRADLGALESVGGAVLEGADTAQMSDDALAATLALIQSAPIHRTTHRAVRTSVFPTPLQSYAGPTPDAVRWRSIGGGVRQAVLNCAGDAKARLLYIPRGVAVPEHSHRGLELTLVLQGAFADSVARFARGDVEVGDGDLEHQPIAETGEDCICLAATDAPLKLKGMMPRLFQPFIGI
jgi:putative transcriptional regulator